jgi:hypothetical protein
VNSDCVCILFSAVPYCRGILFSSSDGSLFVDTVVYSFDDDCVQVFG